MIDDLRQIAIFAKTIDHGSFRGAAAELHLSPSVVSHHIQQLEEKLGVALLYRSTRRLTLTRDGEQLLSSARLMLEAIESGLNDLKERAAESSGELRATIPAVLSSSRLIDSFTDFGAKFPNVRLDLSFSDVRKHLINDGFDLAIRMGPSVKKGPTSRTLFSVKRIAVTGQCYFANNPAISEPKDLNEREMIELAPTRMIKTIFRKKGSTDVQVKMKAQITSDDVYAVYGFAKTGKGIAFVPDFLALDDLKTGVMTQLLPDWRLDPIYVYAEWPANAPKGGLIKRLIDQLPKEN